MSDSPLERARAYLARRGWSGAELVPLQGDASTRSYFRAGLVSRTEILLVEPDPGPERLRPFLSNARFLDELGLGPPRILDEAAELGILALEDLGDISLRRALEGVPAASSREKLFGAALDVLVRLQGEGSARLDASTSAWHTRFDEAVFARELGMFVSRYLDDLVKCERTPQMSADLDTALAWLSRTLGAAPAVLTHRDYHIDNLHVSEGRLRIIDFQDARWGPASYDPASLLNDRDVHRFLHPASSEPLLSRFAAARGLDWVAFQDEYRLAVVQRSLKAVGTFADQAVRRGKTHYLEYINPTLVRARAAARHFEPLVPVVEIVDHLLPAPARESGTC